MDKFKIIFFKLIYTAVLIVFTGLLIYGIKSVCLINSIYLFCGLTIIYLSLSIKKLSGIEKGIKEFVGIPCSFVKSGLCFLLFPAEKVIVYPKEIQRIDVSQQEVITAAGKSVIDNELCSPAKIIVDTTFYFFWPDDNDLIAAYCATPKPYHPEKVKEFFEHTLMNGIRATGSKLTWRDCTDPIFQQKIVETLKSDNSVLSKAKISYFQVEITNIALPESLEIAITKPQIAQFDKLAEIELAEAEREKRRLVGLGNAEAEAEIRKAIYKEISSLGDVGLAYEALLTLRQMSDSQSTTILYGLPTELSDILQKALSTSKDTSPEEIVDKLGGHKGLSKLTEMIKKLLNK